MAYKIHQYYEQYNKEINIPELATIEQNSFKYVFPRKRSDMPCFFLKKRDNKGGYHLTTNYFIGVDWIEKNKSALYIAPKINTRLDRSPKEIDYENIKETDYLKMLFSTLKEAEATKKIEELFIVKWDDPEIEIEQKQDLLTPLLVVEFLAILKNIVRKGLKKSYYKVNRNLNSKVKGKILVGATIKNNLLKNKRLQTYCSYDEFGLDNKENRLLKKALDFVKKYLPSHEDLFENQEENPLQDIFNYINPAFNSISSEISLNEIKYSKTNAFYKEYERGIQLAKLILRRFGYNLSNTVKDKISTPPFWIDMSKLFELYVLALLKERFHHQVEHHFTTHGNELDYILNSKDYKMVIDAKYKLKYIDGHYHEDIRQVSGYVRLKKVYSHFYKDEDYNKVIDGLIIHPDQENGIDHLLDIELDGKTIDPYYNFYKIGVKLPTL